mmetsp:Transcript_31295/g.48528  ORF Transcript_31295/g.48528 Transcript_31295/m.48528 type:complete len:220 (-) Transcript_31295:180-839(-)
MRLAGLFRRSLVFFAVTIVEVVLDRPSRDHPLFVIADDSIIDRSTSRSIRSPSRRSITISTTTTLPRPGMIRRQIQRKVRLDGLTLRHPPSIRNVGTIPLHPQQIIVHIQTRSTTTTVLTVHLNETFRHVGNDVSHLDGRHVCGVVVRDAQRLVAFVVEEFFGRFSQIDHFVANVGRAGAVHGGAGNANQLAGGVGKSDVVAFSAGWVMEVPDRSGCQG